MSSLRPQFEDLPQGRTTHRWSQFEGPAVVGALFSFSLAP